MKEIIILGAGGFGREVMWIIRKMEQYKIISFYDDTLNDNINKEIHSIPVINTLMPFINERYKHERPHLISAVGSNELRKKWAEKYSGDFEFVSIIDPGAHIGPNVKIGIGTIVTTGCVLTVDINIGNYVNINLNCTIGHDTTIANYCNLSPGCGISGGVFIKEGVDLGTGAVVIPKVTINAWSIIGAGSVVVKDVPERVLALGIPAKVARKINNVY